jgi:hypothetical protein
MSSLPNRPPAGSSPTSIIESWLPSLFANGKRVQGTSPRLRLTLSGADGGEWNLQISEGDLIMKRWMRTIGAEHENPDIWIRQSTTDFLAVIFPSEDLLVLLPPSVDVVDLLSPESQEMELLEKLNGRIKFELEGRRRRRWALDAAFGHAGMKAGRPRTTVTIDSGTCEKLSAGVINPLQALLGGRLRVDGDKTFAMQVLMLVATRIGG